MVGDILKGAIRVLKREGGRHFTTIRVAEETGISVGSLYQYFPNKESILFQIQLREWQETSGILRAMLTDRRHPPAQRLRRTIHAFFQSEWEEASLRKALLETGVMLDETEQSGEIKATVHLKTSEFLAEMLPGLSSSRRRHLAEFVFTTIGALAEEITTRPQSEAQVRRWAADCADMILAFLAGPGSRAA